MNKSRIMAPLLGALILTGVYSGPIRAQAPDPHAQQGANQPADNQALTDQIQQLREQVSRLQQTIQQQGAQRKTSGARQRMQMGSQTAQQGMQNGGGGMGEMGAMPMGEMGEMGEMSSMPGGGQQGMGMDQMKQGMAAGMDMMKEGMSMGMDMMKEGMAMGMDQMKQGMSMPDNMSGMAAMGNMKAAPRVARQSGLPGFPGASHLYHIGATGFFLDHPQHITLTTEQRTRLTQIQQKALLEKATAQRKIEEAEQQLFTLTGADQPDQARIDAKVQEIANLNTQQRLAYIRTVGEAARVLTAEQQRQLLGQAGPAATR